MTQADPLALLQRQVMHALRATDAPPADWIAGDDAQATRRLHIYRHAYRARLAQVLADNFPMLARLVGDEWWRRLAGAYLDAHPAHRYSIRWFGEHLPEWLETAALFDCGPALADLARLEWALGLVFDAHDDTPLSSEALARMPPAQWPDVRFRFGRSLARLSLRHRIGPTFHALQTNVENVPAPEAGAGEWLVWRKGRRPHFRSVDSEESMLLDLASQGEPFSVWCEAVAARSELGDAAARAVGYLLRWFGEGIVIAVDVGCAQQAV
jgi:hypothetical protein